ncbi:hypothetical protein FHG87_022550 [Trinorchestia longiramus]|nr:hypothetical protein FHG87_022550 [Trinorchestia longiramus]
MSDCNPKSIPCDPSANKLDVSSDSENLCDPKLFREIVGSLIYLMTCTRPDICYVVTLLSQHLTRPTNAHLNLCKFVLKYLKGTILFSLRFVKSEDPMQITGFSDSDWGGSSDRKSISGYVFKSSSSSSLISWKSKKQNIVALSSCKAEYIALTYAVQGAIFLKQLLCDMDGYDEPVGIFVDNRGAIDLAKNPVHHQRSKHIDIRYHFIRAIIQDNKAVLSFVPSEENMADMFTKPVTRQSLLKFKFSLPKEQSERQKWLDVIPPRENFVVDPDKFFVCEIHWGADPPLIKLRGGSMRPGIPPSIFYVPASCLSSPNSHLARRKLKTNY